MMLAPALAFVLLFAGGPSAPAAPRSWEITKDLQVRELAPGVWLHVSWQVLSSGDRFPSNGLLVREGGKLWMIDTAWGDESTEKLLGWIRATLKLPVAGVIATHHHADRLGGGATILAARIPLHASPRTLALAEQNDLPRPQPLAGLAEPGGVDHLGPLEVFYPGPGHTWDNVVVWIPSAKILHGGCAVRPGDARDLGNKADADVAEWPRSIQRVKERYGSRAVKVVPGHGDVGGPELLDHTLALFLPAELK